MKKNIFACLLLLLTSNLHAQKNYFNYTKIKIEQVAAIEKQFNGRFLLTQEVINNTRSNAKYDHFNRFARPKSIDFEPTFIEYYYAENDGSVRSIRYRWPVERSVRKSKFFKTYNAQFDKIVAYITNELGLPNINQSEVTEITDNKIFEGCFERKMEWKNEQFRVVTRLLWSNDRVFVTFETTVNYY